MGDGRLGVTGDLVAKHVEEELDQGVEVATPRHQWVVVEIALALQPKQVNVTQRYAV